MCVGSKGLGKVLNPIGAIAPKKGIGQLLDPVGALGRSVGGETGKLLDPTGALRGDHDQKVVQQKQQRLQVQRPNANRTGPAKGLFGLGPASGSTVLGG